LLRELEAEKPQINNRIETLNSQGRRKRPEIDKLRRELSNLDSQQGQQLSMLQKAFPEVARAWTWIQENQDKFELEVFGPAMLTCSVKDKRYSSHIQSLLQLDDFTCFTTQSRKDHKTLSQALYGQLGVSVTIRTCLQPLSAFTSPFSNQQVREFGLDGFARDYIDGPDPVLAMLCSEKKLHSSGVSLEDISEAMYNKLVASERINSWAAGKQTYRITRRRDYGPQAVSTTTRYMQPGRFWTDQPVDPAEREAITTKLDEAVEALAEMKQQHQKAKEELSKVDDRRKEIEEQIVRVLRTVDVPTCITLLTSGFLESTEATKE
jgi:structural maintenance of chromosomes protein 5